MSRQPSAAWLAEAEASADDTFDDLTPPGLALGDLALRPIWIAWRLEPDTDPAKPERKVPYAATGTGAGKVNDPKTWGTRAQAEARAAKLLQSGRKGGVGIVLGTMPGDPQARIGGIDLDTCRDAKTKILASFAAETLARIPSYAEVSPSGSGVKVLFTYQAGDLDALKAAFGKDAMGKSWKHGTGHHPPAIELYLGKRWFAVTGDRVPGSPPDLRQISRDTLLELVRVHGPAFAAGTQPKPQARKSKDESRSGRALALAGKVRRRGGTCDQFEEALLADPGLAAWAGDSRQVDRTWARAGDGIGDLAGFAFNEDGVALAFVARYRHELRWDYDIGRWHRWTGGRWQVEKGQLAFDYARKTCRDLGALGLLDSETKPLAKAATASAVERFARADRAMEVKSDIWDCDALALGTPDGTVDLTTGRLRSARLEDFITKLCSVSPEKLYDPGLDHPQWTAFLAQATGDDQGLIRFLQQWCGYCLTGETTEHALLFIYGPGGNGKSVFLNTLKGILGDYARVAAMETFTESMFASHSEELARLRGARLVCVSETEEGKAWASGRVKNLVAGDTVTARFLYQSHFEFKPEFKLTIVGNNKPVLNNVDPAMRRRMNIVPFTRTPTTVDPDLESKLQDEWPAILAWMIVGCVDWKANRLVRPQIVLETTADYFETQDTFGQWIEERCELGRSNAESNARLMADWGRFAESSGERNRITPRAFADRLRSKGFEPIKNTDGIRGRGFRGLRIGPCASDARSEDDL